MRVRNETIDIVANELLTQYHDVAKRLTFNGVQSEQQVIINHLSSVYIPAFKEQDLLNNNLYQKLENRIVGLMSNKAIFREDDRHIIFSAMKQALKAARAEQVNALQSAREVVDFFNLNDINQQEKNVRVQKINQLVAVMSSPYYDYVNNDIANILAANKSLNEQITKRYQDQHQALLDVTDDRLNDLSARKLSGTDAYKAAEKLKQNLSHQTEAREIKGWAYYRDRTVNAYRSLFVKNDNGKCDYDDITGDKSKSASRFAMVIQMISSSLSLSMAAVTFASIVHSLVTRGHIFYMQPKGQDFAECANQVQKNLKISRK
jgi:hypothetical protein